LLKSRDSFASASSRMVRRDPRLQPHVTEKPFRSLVFALHCPPPSKIGTRIDPLCNHAVLQDARKIRVFSILLVDGAMPAKSYVSMLKQLRTSPFKGSWY
jgi:hypothetical protein